MNLRRISDFIWEMPKTGKMRVPARIFASEKLLGIVKVPKKRGQQFGREPMRHRVRRAVGHVVHKIKHRIGRGQKYRYRPRK